jgi:hypothetical protein
MWFFNPPRMSEPGNPREAPLIRVRQEISAYLLPLPKANSPGDRPDRLSLAFRLFSSIFEYASPTVLVSTSIPKSSHTF